MRPGRSLHRDRHRASGDAFREGGTPPLFALREPSRSSVRPRKRCGWSPSTGGRLMRRRTMPRRREDPPKPQLSYFTKSDGKLARVRATARALSSVSDRDCSCARCKRAASLRNALMRSCLIWMSLQGERARRNRVFASRRRASCGSCVASRTPSSRSSFHTSSKSREKRARASGVNECRSLGLGMIFLMLGLGMIFLMPSQTC